MKEAIVHRAGFVVILSMLLLLVIPGDCFSRQTGIHIASFREKDRAEAQVRSLRESGLPAFSRTVTLPGRGDWHRVFAGMHEDEESARRAAELLMERGIVGKYALLPLIGPHEGGEEATSDEPVHGIHIASFREQDRAEAQVRSLRESGLPAFSRTVTLPGRGHWHRVFAGMHGSREDAQAWGEYLKDRGSIEGYSVMVLVQEPGAPQAEPGLSREGQRHDRAVGSADGPERPDIRSREEEAPAKDDAPLPRLQREPERHPSVAAETAAPPDAAVNDVPSPAEPLRTREEPGPGDRPGAGRGEPGREKPLSMDTAPDPGQIDTETGPHRSPAEAAHPVLSEAHAYLESGNYGVAQERFRTLMRDETLGAETREIAARRAADAIYLQALEEKPHRIHDALEGYRDILRRYPDGEGNDTVLLRMAEAYLRLGLYQEGFREANRLRETYPRSAHVPRALYLRGLFQYSMLRNEDAVTDLRAYVDRYPDGPDYGDALLRLGDVQSRMERFEQADAVFEQVLQRWPSLEDVPLEKLVILLAHYMRSGNYEQGLSVCLVCFNLYPDAPEAAEFLFGAGRILAAQDRVQAALAVLSRVRELYPDSQQALESIVIMADLGLRSPGRELPRHIFDGMQYYLDPLSAFDEALGITDDRRRQEELLFLKMNALIQLRRYRDAFDTARYLQEQSPWGPFRKDVVTSLLETADRLIDEHYSDGDYLDVADVYLAVRPLDFTGRASFDSVLRVGESLRATGLDETARAVFESQVTRYPNHQKGAVSLSLIGDMDREAGAFEAAAKRAKEAIAWLPECRRASELLGDLARREGRYRDAARFYAAAAETQESPVSRARIHTKHGHALKALGEYSAAAGFYAKALEEGVEDSPGFRVSVGLGPAEGLAACRHRQERYEESIALYRGVLEQEPEGAAAYFALYRLGQSYARRGASEQSVRTFDALRDRADDDFWRQIAAYGKDYEAFRDRYESPAALQ